MIDVDLRRYGQDKDYEKAVNSLLSGKTKESEEKLVTTKKETKMTRNEALNICQEALEKHEGGKEAYFSILEDLNRLEELWEEEDEE